MAEECVIGRETKSRGQWCKSPDLRQEGGIRRPGIGKAQETRGFANCEYGVQSCVDLLASLEEIELGFTNGSKSPRQLVLETQGR